jgi:hypothetical protein
VSVWGGTRFHAVNIVTGSICHCDFDTGIVAAIPHGRHLLVVTELEALLVDDRCEIIQSLLTHSEVIVDVQLGDGRLRVRDLQGRVLSVDVPEL